MSAGFSRRAFLASGASLAGVGWAGVLAPRAAASTAPPVPSEKLALRRSVFIPLRGQSFRIAHDRGSLTVVLRQVGDLQPTVRPGAEDQFSLIFSHHWLRPGIRQGTYAVSHPQHGQIRLFVVPVGRHRYAQRYQAIIDSRPLRMFHQA